jgi:hypothetical protein
MFYDLEIIFKFNYVNVKLLRKNEALIMTYYYRLLVVVQVNYAKELLQKGNTIDIIDLWFSSLADLEYSRVCNFMAQSEGG